MAEQVPSTGLSPIGPVTHGSRRGIVVGGFPPGSQIDQDTLEVAFYKAVKGDMKCGVPEISSCHFTEDMQRAYVEFTDPAAITCLLQKPVILHGHKLTVEEIDLNQVYRPYLIVRGLPPFMSQQTEFLKSHFQTLSSAQIQSIEFNGPEALIRFVNPTVALNVASMELEILASKLQLNVGYEISSQKEQYSLEEQILTIQISGLPSGMNNPGFIKMSIEHYLMKLEIKVTSCEVINDVAYVTLDNPSKIQDIVSHPPQEMFMSNVILHYFATPKSKVPGASGSGGGSPSVTTVQQDPQPPMSQNHPFSPPYQQSSPMKASTPPSAPQPYLPGGEWIQKQQIPTNYQQQDPMAPVGCTALPFSQNLNQGYPVSSNTFQRTTSSSSTSSQAWDPNSSGGSIGLRSSSQRMDLNASSSSVQSIPSARSPHKWETQGSSDSNEGYTAGQMNPDQYGRHFQTSDGPVGMPYQMAQSPPQVIGPRQYQRFGQNLQQQGIGSSSSSGGGFQQLTGSPQGGHMIPPNPSERVRPSSGPIASQSQNQAENQRGGLWMGPNEPQQQQRTQGPNGGRLFQMSQHPGQGNQGALPVQSASQNDLVIEDIEIPCGQPVIPQQMVTKVHVQNIPPEFRNIGLQYYLEKVMQNQVTCKVELFHTDGLAIFQPPIDMNVLVMRLRQQPLANSGGVLSLSPLLPSSTLIVSNLPQNTQDITLSSHFQRFSGSNSVINVKLISSDKALVTFVNHTCVQEVFADPQHVNLGYFQLVVKEYYPFMRVEETDTNVHTRPVNTQPTAPKFNWKPQREKLSAGKYNFAKRGLNKLNQALQQIKAKATLEDSHSLCISPLEGASDISNWEDNVKEVCDEYFTDYFEDIIQIAKEAKADVLSYVFAEDRRPAGVYVSLQGECLSVCGGRDQVQKVLDEINEMMLTAQVSTKDICRPRKHIRYLVKFCSHEMDNIIPAVQYEPLVDQSVIRVTANPRGFTAFEMVIEEQLKPGLMSEQTIDLSPALYQLLSSARGEAKIMEVLGIEMPKIVYDFEEAAKDDEYILCILSRDKESSRSARKQLLPYTHSKAIKVNQQKIRACTDKKWRELDHNLTSEHFVVISVHPDKSEIVVAGETIVLDDITKQIEKFLRDHTSVEEQVKVDANVWNVVNLNFTNEINALDSDAKSRHVAITWPKSTCRQDPSTIVIRGEPKDVDDFKVKVQMLGMKVYQKETKISQIPALVHVLGSMDDRIKVLRTQNKASIELHFEKGTAEDSQATGELPRNLCSATASNGYRVNIYMGDFTQNQPVTAILNFVSLDPHINVGTLKLLASTAGQEMQDDFKQKLAHMIVRKPGVVFQTKHGQLKCSQLLHCFLPPWDQSSSATGMQYLEDGLKAFLRGAGTSSSVLITPFTSKPLEYPVEVFSEKLLEVCGNQDIQVTVYVDEIEQARVFEELLTNKKFNVHTHVPVGQIAKPTASLGSSTSSLTSAKGISNPIKSFISLTQGDMLKQQAEVFINSTNTNLDLKQGILSKKLLEICGDDLQKACSDYAPLNTGDVAVTDAKNLPCKFIFHIALPDYQNRNSERTFRETVRTVLQTAKEKDVKSIAIPSLGVGNLNYPASVSARILFDQVIAFHAQFRNATIQKFHFVIYEKTVYEEFSKEYAQRMSDGAQVKAVGRSVKPNQQKQGCGLLLGVFKVNIAEETSDVIVNTTTEDMNLSASAVSKAILKTAGPKLQTMCQQLVDSGMKLEHGQTVVMNATGGLRCKKIIQAYVPIRQVATSSQIDHFQLVGAIVSDCLKKADVEGLKSITFPAFGLGQGGYEVNEVADPILKAIQKFSLTNPTSLKTVRIAIFDQDHHQKFYDYFCKFFDYDPSLASPTSPGVFQALKGKLGLGSSHDDYIELNQSAPGRAQPPTPSPLWAVSRSMRSSNPVVVFQIYAASDQKCNEIEKHLQDEIKSRAVTKKLENVLICDYMIEDDVEDIRKFEDQFGVEVKLMMQEKEIQISGEAAKVSEATMKIKDLVVEIERAESELRLFEWQWADDDGTTEVYQYEASVKLERAFRKKLEGIDMIIENVSVMVDLKSMEEIDKSTGKRHDVKRVKKPYTIEYPSTWEDEPVKDGKMVTMHMFPIAAGTPEYQEAIKEFADTVGVPHTIVEVKRIQNRNEYSRYIALRDAIQRKHNKPVATRRLFHGSKQESLELIAFRGFNRNFAADANAAYYGRGVYFAVNASYSAQAKYSIPDKDTGNQHMFVCSVLVGEYTKGTNNMKVAPPLQPGSKDVFDSLVEDEKNPTIFVAMTDAQAYPEYLITFKVTGKSK